MDLYRKHIILFFLVLLVLNVKGQDIELPPDFRQHNLTEYNSSLFSPVFSLDRNQAQSLAFWSRWQWQTVDGDPTSFFLNYSRGINRSMAGGIAVIQHNTGIYLNTGGVINYAITTQIAPGLHLAAGLNVFGYQRELADDRLLSIPNINLPDPEDIEAFILQVAPGVQVSYGPLSLGAVAENILQYNFNSSRNEEGDNGNILIGYAGYHIPVNLLSNTGTSYVQPTVYVKRIPGFDNQVGITALLSTPKFWLQGGYNSFYGVSGGVGGRFAKNFSIGAMIEYGTQGDLQDRDPSFELVTAFNFGPRRQSEIEDMVKQQEEIIEEMPEEEDAEANIKEQKAIEDARIKADSIAQIEKMRRLQKQQDSLISAQKIKEERLAEQIKQQRLDSIANAKREEERRKIIQQRLDSIKALEEARKAEEITKIAQKQPAVTPQKGEKYEEVVNEKGIAPGYYLIA
ncbi:MAG: PorP/SprF family type IX secretion system membrane protein, partial [Eudoraea sp.]|nr:PorP/SprF family type IX secretion system membrane protein [Eudoraea sp.]